MLAPRSVGRPGPRIAVLVVVERLKVTREADASVLTAQDGARVADVCTVDNRAPTLAFEVEEDGDGNGAADDPLRLHSFVDREVRARHRRRHERWGQRAHAVARDVDDSEVAAAGEFGRRAVERFARQQVRPEIQMAQLSQCGEGAGFNRRDLVVDELEHEQRRWQHTGVYHAERVAGHVQLLEVR